MSASAWDFEGFDYAEPADVFREHAALSAFENDGARDFDLGGLADLPDAAYDALEPTQWPIRIGELRGRERLFANGEFYTAHGRANFVAPDEPALKTKLSPWRPLRLNTGRVRDQWHTMTRTGESPRLARHIVEPFVEINPRDAQLHNVGDGGFATVATDWGSCVLRAVVTDRQPEGQIFAPIHWSDETASHARVGALVAPFTDPFSGQPEAKATPAQIAPRCFSSQGFLLSREKIATPPDCWRTRVAIEGGWGYRLAADAPAHEWRSFFREAFGTDGVIEYLDEARGAYRAAAWIDERLVGVLFIAPAPCSWDLALALFARKKLSDGQRKALLSGRSPDGVADDGPVICACFGVGAKRIEAVIGAGCDTTAAIGKALRAGTNCGSCLPEICRLLAQPSG